jgi:hypothetical protein
VSAVCVAIANSVLVERAITYIENGGKYRLDTYNIFITLSGCTVQFWRSDRKGNQELRRIKTKRSEIYKPDIELTKKQKERLQNINVQL